ncbi:hypothetical protein APR41_01375 [Salegentibacter salinarum]|uniref:Uncharacterized protein n=1 Tax=Salegentibacter salinarum TaxID=447422 RepID=A0A2N0U3U4_9FLAO|nr:hypothetical protein [Salegentibacter salinarum]PKD21664.1 hypothetical protein APR41_01375 [Salegentibacter salinarum]SKB35218.1 hypothetical protein SAMN05660903_00290 [Salegentibacter salinarum]
MERIKINISAFLGIAILIASLLPALHSLSHETSLAEDDISSVHISHLDAELGCDVCSFHLTTSDVPEFYSYTLYAPLKEEIYIVSLEDKVNPYPFRLFQLRAPPAMIG